MSLSANLRVPVTVIIGVVSAIIAGVFLAATLIIYLCTPPIAVETDTVHGPAAPVPSIEDHVAAVMEDEKAAITYAGGINSTAIKTFTLPALWKNGDLYRVVRDNEFEKVEQPTTTWETLKALGVEVICSDMIDKRGKIARPVNPYLTTAYMPCSRITHIQVTDGIVVERNGKILK